MTEDKSHPIDKPRLRVTVELMPYEHEGQEGFLLRDNFVRDRALFLAPEALALLMFFDGQNSIKDIQNKILAETGQVVPSEEIASFASMLDEHLFLDSPAYEAWMAKKKKEYAGLSARQSLAPEMGVPQKIEDANALFDELFAPFSEVAIPDNLPAVPRGIVMPHIDLDRGRKSYALMERTLASAPPADVYIILGVNHNFLSENPFIITDRAYESPLGKLTVDEEILNALKDRLDWDPLEDQVAHATEHSIEFPSILLRRLHPDAPITILPVLSNFINREDNRVTQFIDELGNIIKQCSRRVAIIASVDFSHVGPMFGAESAVEEADLLPLGALDKATLNLLAEGKSEAFWDDIMDHNNVRHIDATQSCYTLLKLLGDDARGKLIDYEQAFDPANTVTFATMVFE